MRSIQPVKARLREADLAYAAVALGIPVASIKAVSEVEAPRGGFLASGEPRILFEAHVFDRLTGGEYRDSHPGLSSARWNKKLYGPAGAHQHKRLQQAVALDREAALMAASWGKFQILGENFHLAGFDTLQDFINAMYAGEPQQLDAFVHFIKADAAMHRALRARDWAEFARRYNGPGYAANHYDTKLAAAYARHGGG